MPETASIMSIELCDARVEERRRDKMRADADVLCKPTSVISVIANVN